MILPISADLETKLQRLLNPGTSDHSTYMYLHMQLLEFVVYKNFKSCGFVMLLHILCLCALKIHFCIHVHVFLSQDLVLIVSSTLGTIRLYYDWTD